MAIQARALETHLIDFALQPLWTCARHIRQRSCCTLFGSSAHCWNTGRSAPSHTMTREKAGWNSIQDRGTEHTFAQAMRNACEKMRALSSPLTGACASWSCSTTGANFKCRELAASSRAAHGPRMPNMRREHSRELGLHSYFRYLEFCAQVPPGARSEAAMMSSSGHGQLPGSCRCEGDGWLRFTAARDSVPARGARVRIVPASQTPRSPLPDLASKGPCLLRPLARLLQEDRVRLLPAESGAKEQCPPATKGRDLAAKAHSRSTVSFRFLPNLPQALHPATSSAMGDAWRECGHGPPVLSTTIPHGARRGDDSVTLAAARPGQDDGVRGCAARVDPCGPRRTRVRRSGYQAPATAEPARQCVRDRPEVVLAIIEHFETHKRAALRHAHFVPAWCIRARNAFWRRALCVGRRAA